MIEDHPTKKNFANLLKLDILQYFNVITELVLKTALNPVNKEYSLDPAQLLALFVAQSNNAYAIFEENDRLLYCNPVYAKQLFGSSPDKLVNSTFSECIRQAYRQKRGLRIKTKNINEWLQQSNKNRWKKAFRTFEVSLLDGSWYLVTEQMIGGKFLFLHATNITQSKEVEFQLVATQEKLKLQAYHDELTNIPNRRAFVERASEEIAKAQRAKTIFSLFIFDIDYFKKINDQYGHLAGDAVLKKLSQLVQSELRPYDFVARIGGEEFALLITDNNLLDSQASIERIREKIQRTPFDFDKRCLNCTVSIGGSSFRQTDKLDDTISRADKNLYLAKKQGRNRLVFSA